MCVAALAACAPGDDDVSPPQLPVGARLVGDSERRAEDVVEAVLDECHRPLRARMQRVKATVTLGSGDRVLCQAALPDRARIRAGKDEWLVLDGSVRSLTGAQVASAEAERLRDIVAVVDAAAFGPLYRADSCARADEAYLLADKRGRETRMTLFPRTLLPSSFSRQEDRVDVLDYLRTSTSWVARGLAHPRLGPCRVVFEDGGVHFPKEYFTATRDPAPGPAAVRAPIPGAVVETQSSTPIVVEGKATRLVLLDDPGAWPSRHEQFRDVIEELQRQEQRIAGFPLLFTDEDGRPRVAAPFRRRANGRELSPPDGYRLAEVPAGKLLVVYPPEGDLEARRRSGEALLRRALANRRLRARGPVVAQPFLHLQAAPPDAEKLEDVTVRVWVRIE